MKRFLSLILVLLLSGTLMAQPPFGKPPGGSSGNNKTSGGNPFNQGKKPSDAQVAGVIVGGVLGIAAEAARKERERREWENRYNAASAATSRNLSTSCLAFIAFSIVGCIFKISSGTPCAMRVTLSRTLLIESPKPSTSALFLFMFSIISNAWSESFKFLMEGVEF
jgi:hypothetical protein